MTLADTLVALIVVLSVADSVPLLTKMAGVIDKGCVEEVLFLGVCLLLVTHTTRLTVARGPAGHVSSLGALC